MKKISVKCISCISYILEENISGKLFDMKIVTGVPLLPPVSLDFGGVRGRELFFARHQQPGTTIGAAKQKRSWGKSCAEIALDDFNALIALFRMSNAELSLLRNG